MIFLNTPMHIIAVLIGYGFTISAWALEVKTQHCDWYDDGVINDTITLLQNNQWQEACLTLQNIYQCQISAQRYDPDIMNNHASCLVHQGNLEQAQHVLDTALAHGDSAPLYKNLQALAAVKIQQAYAIGTDGNPNAKIPPPTLQVWTQKRSLVPSNTANQSTSMQPVESPDAVEAKEHRGLVLMTPKSVPKPDTTGKKSTSATTEAELKALLESWRLAWSAQNIPAYLSFYANDFKPQKRTLDKWKAHKSWVIRHAEYIHVSVSEIEFTLTSTQTAILDFNQYFENNRFSDLIRKRLLWIHTPKGWRIQQEMVLKKL